MTKEYIFNNRIESLSPLLNHIIASLVQYYPPVLTDERVSGCKQALIELLTNGIKHSDTENSLIQIIFNQESVTIKKSDAGKPFLPGNIRHWPLEKERTGDRIVIYRGDFTSLTAVVRSETSLVFEVEEEPIEKVEVSSLLLEHYGFLILAKVSDSFTYEYDVRTGENIFICEIGLKDI